MLVWNLSKERLRRDTTLPINLDILSGESHSNSTQTPMYYNNYTMEIKNNRFGRNFGDFGESLAPCY